MCAALSAGDDHPVTVEVTGDSASLTTGELTARVTLVDRWRVDFLRGDRLVTSSTERSVGIVTDGEGRSFVHERLALGVGETVYGLGERFGPFVKNGQAVDIWNADGGTAAGDGMHHRHRGVGEAVVDQQHADAMIAAQRRPDAQSARPRGQDAQQA